MKYQRVLYTKNFTSELKAKLRIVSYDQRRSLKGNVYYVSFASDADIKYADKACKRLQNVALKPFQPRPSTKTKYEQQFNIGNNEKSLTPSSISLSSSIHILSPPAMLTCPSDNNSSFNASQSGPSRRTDETLEEHAMCVLSPCLESKKHLTKSDETSNRNEKQQLIDNVKSCLSAMKTARQAANELCQLYSKNSPFSSKQKYNDCLLLKIERGLDCRVGLNRLFQVHSTAFYLKATMSAQIKNLLLAGRRLSWQDLSNDINEFRIDVSHEQLFIAQMSSAKHILSKIDSTTSMTMSSKLAYQLTKLSH